MEKAPSKHATTLPDLSIANSQGSVGSLYSFTCGRVPLETVLSL